VERGEWRGAFTKPPQARGKTAEAKVGEIREEGGEHFVDLALETKNQDGKPVITGTATARIDP